MYFSIYRRCVMGNFLTSISFHAVPSNFSTDERKLFIEVIPPAATTAVDRTVQLWLYLEEKKNKFFT